MITKADQGGLLTLRNAPFCIDLSSRAIDLRSENIVQQNERAQLKANTTERNRTNAILEIRHFSYCKFPYKPLKSDAESKVKFQLKPILQDLCKLPSLS